MIPINKNSADPFYRYKMPPLHVIREGKQGNPRTIIVNFVTVCDSLRRSPELTKQFFIYQLSVQIKMKNDKLVINGEVAGEILQDILYQFIDLLLICRHCDNPETSIRLSKEECPNKMKKTIGNFGEENTSHKDVRSEYNSSDSKENGNIKHPHNDIQELNNNMKDFGITQGDSIRTKGPDADNTSHLERGVPTEDTDQRCPENSSEEEPTSDLILECYACGAITPLRSNHKIIIYILKNQQCLEGENSNYKGIRQEKNEFTKINEDEKYTHTSHDQQVSHFKSIIKEVFEKDNFSLLNDLKPKLKNKENRVKFFEILEEYSVQNEIVQSIGQVFDVLKEFLSDCEFEYFRKRSKVVQKKESVRIRNILSNYVDYKS